MKQLLWNILIVPRKLIGLVWYWFVFPFRHYARSVVHNYALQQKHVPIKRLRERFPVWSIDRGGWVLHDVHDVGYNGFVKYREVSKVQFWLVVFLIWGWVDDDSNQDTYDAGHCRRYTEGDLKNSVMSRLFRKQLQQAIDDGVYGNTFDLGDYRAEDANFSFPAALIWNTRNSAYNFYYLFME